MSDLGIFGLEGKTAIVTGGERGTGFEIAPCHARTTSAAERLSTPDGSAGKKSVLWQR